MDAKYNSKCKTVLFFCFYFQVPGGGEGSACGIVVNMLDCDIIVSKFELKLHYYIHFQPNTLKKGMNALTSQL